VLALVPGAKGDRDRNVGAGRRKADDERHQPRQQSAAALDHRDNVRAALAIEIVHGAQRLRQRIPSLAEDTPIERHALVSELRRRHPRNRSSSPALGT
jgi:hypothetical protein